MNQTIGHIQCPICNTPGEVRRYKGSNRGSMYWACECGQIRPVKSQRYILKYAEFYPDAGELLPPDGKLFTPKAPAAPVSEKPEPKAPPIPVTKKSETPTPAKKTAAPVSGKPVTKKPAATAPTPQRNAWGFYE